MNQRVIIYAINCRENLFTHPDIHGYDAINLVASEHFVWDYSWADFIKWWPTSWERRNGYRISKIKWIY